MSSKIITETRALVDKATAQMVQLNNAHTIECIKLKVAIKNANGNIYRSLTQNPK